MTPGTIVREFGAEVRRRRLDMGLTIDALADRAGLSALWLGKVERGEMTSGAGLVAVAKIAMALDALVSELFPGRLDLTTIALEAAQTFMRLRPADQANVLRLMKALVRQGRRS